MIAKEWKTGEYYSIESFDSLRISKDFCILNGFQINDEMPWITGFGKSFRVGLPTASSPSGQYPAYVQIKSAANGCTVYIPLTADLNVTRLTDVPFKDLIWHQQHCITKTGWDPEMFVTDEKNTLLPAFSFLPSKQNPVVYSNGYKIRNLIHPERPNLLYYDGFQAEFTTYPIHCHGYGVDYLRSGLRGILMEARNKVPKAKLSLKSVFKISPAMMMASDDEFVALGCKPSENVYGVEPLVVEDARMFPYRVAGGHIHFAISEPIKTTHLSNIIKALDLFLALPAVGMFADVDDPLRREFYGKAGEHRIPSYGFEYRTMSNAWLCSPIITHGLMDLARRAVAGGQVKGFAVKSFGTSEEEVQEVINYCDVKRARKIVETNWSAWQGLLASGHYGVKMQQAMCDGILGGVGTIVPEYENVEQNWSLGIPEWRKHSDDSNQTWAKRFGA